MVNQGNWTLQSFWSTKISSNVQPPDGQRILREGLELIQGLKQHFKQGEVAYCSSHNGQAGSIEVCIVYPNGNLPFPNNNAVAVLEAIATDKKHLCSGFAGDGKTISFFCNADMAARLTKLELLLDPQKTKADEFAQLYAKVAQAGDQKSSDFPDAASPLLISRSYINALHSSEGDGLEGTIKDITNRMNTVKDYNFSQKIIYLYAHGVICTHPTLVNQAGGVSEGGLMVVMTLVIAGLCVIGGTEGAGFILGLGFFAVAFIVFLALNPQRSILLVVNDAKVEVKLLREHIESGKRNLVTANLPAWTADNDWASAGFYVYDKRDNALVGNQFGLTFEANPVKFSIGMETPSTQRNCVEVIEGDDTGKACRIAGDEAYDHRWTNARPRVDIKMAHFKGNTNYARAIVMQQ